VVVKIPSYAMRALLGLSGIGERVCNAALIGLLTYRLNTDAALVIVSASYWETSSRFASLRTGRNLRRGFAVWSPNLVMPVSDSIFVSAPDIICVRAQ
jgi:hypothetical protein